MDQDLCMPGSYPLNTHSEPRCEDVSSEHQDMSQSMIDVAKQSREGEIDVVDEGMEKIVPEDHIDDAELATLLETVKLTAIDEDERPSHNVKEGPLAFPEDDFEAVTREIRNITDAAGRRGGVATISVAANADQSLDPYDEIIDARTSDIHIITNHISVQNRGMEDEPPTPYNEAVLTNVVAEDRLLADYLHSRSQSHHESEGNLKAYAPQLADLSSGASALEETCQPIDGFEEEWPHCDVTSSETLAESNQVGLKPRDARTDSDMTMGAEDGGESSNQRPGISVQAHGRRPRRWSSNSVPRYYGRAIFPGKLAVGEDEKAYSESVLESSQLELASTSSQESAVDDLSTFSTSEGIMIRPRRRSHILVSREELALKLQNIQEKTRDNRLASLAPGEEPISQSLPSAPRPRWWPHTDTKVPRAVIPAASTDRRGTSAIVRFSVSQDDLRVDFEPVQPENEVVAKAPEETGDGSGTSEATSPKKISLWGKIRGIMSRGTSKSMSRPDEGEMKGSSG